MLLNITNGDYLNAKLSKENDGEFFPFREAMIQGFTCEKIFSDEFISLRAKSLGVSETDYKNYAKEILQFISNHSTYKKLKLWFGKDTFCQLNLLTLLALLEQINYLGEVELVIIDDETGNILSSPQTAKLGVYQNLYKTVIIERVMPNHFGVIDKRAIELYFDYLSPNGYLANLIKQNSSLSGEELLLLILENSKEYGLSDLNVKELILKTKNSNIKL